MKPLRLELTAFGSYPGTEVVDFTVLAPRGLFVVTGPTGTGKTTIFDAMCFALYGVMPRKGAGEARSHHADAAAETVVRFEFECDGVRYTATRTPEYERPARRGGGVVKQNASVLIVRHEADGATTELAASVRAANAVSEELLGLDPAQFQRVVLLPQGDVAQFLNADSKAREELLGQLFGGQIYDALANELARRSTDLERAFRDVEVALKEQLATAGRQVERLEELLGLEPAETDDDSAPSVDARDRLGARLAATEAGCAALALRSTELREESTVAALASQRDVDLATRFDEHAGATERVAELEQRRPAIVAAAAEAERSAATRPVLAAAARSAQLAEQLAAARTARHALRHELDASFAELGVMPAPQTVAEMTATRTRARLDQDTRRAMLTALRTATEEHDAAIIHRDERRRALEQFDSDLANAEERERSIRARLSALEPALVDVGSLTARIAELDELIGHRRRVEVLGEQVVAAQVAAEAAASHHRELFARFVATEAPRLAQQLVPGEPCAVCGSTEHPRPATAGDDQPTSFDDVTAAAELRDGRERARNDLEKELEKVVGRLGEHASSSVDELQANRDIADAASTAAAQARDEHAELTDDLRALGPHLDELRTERARVDEQVLAAGRSVAATADVLTQARTAADGIDEAALASVDRLLDRLDTLCADAPSRDEELTRAETNEDAAGRALAEALDASPFATVDEARAAALDVDEESRRQEAARGLDKELESLAVVVQTLLGQGVPDQRPDVEASRRRADEAAEVASAAGAAAASAGSLRAEAQRSLDEHDRQLEQAGAAAAAATAAKLAHKVCSSGGALRMSLQRWVLAQELDRVTAAANVHLARMTSGRYSLRRQLGVADARRASGLELEVLDAHTGRPRSTSSLSGGEQFQASLALALGLADVVSHGGAASGRVFEALFVDEGFGSLDQDALRDAIDTLHQLRATGRMVGAITHVEAMKQELHPGIEVHRRSDGRGSTLIVNP